MITEIQIKDNTRSPLPYLPDLPAFRNRKTFTFKPGINVVVGPNGSGKTTLMELIYSYGLLKEGITSELSRDFATLRLGLWDHTGEFMDGVKVKADWMGTFFRYLPKAELLRLGDGVISGSIDNLTTFMSHASTGESISEGLGILFRKMFSKDTNLEFPIREISEKSHLKDLFRYYKDNRIEVSKEDYEFTVLLDEPDRNLDVRNIRDLYKILSHHKPQTQIIAVIHNPILLYKLSGVREINFIEMTPGYMEEIKKFIRQWL